MNGIRFTIIVFIDKTISFLPLKSIAVPVKIHQKKNHLNAIVKSHANNTKLGLILIEHT